MMPGRPICGILLGLLLLLGAAGFVTRLKVRTNVLDLLPRTDAPVVELTRRMVDGRLGRTVLISVSAPDEDSARNGAAELGRRLEESKLFNEVLWRRPDPGPTFHAFYFSRRGQMLTPELRADLAAPDARRRMFRRVERELHRPTSLLTGQLLEEDPLLLFPALVNSWSEQGGDLELRDGILGREAGDAFHCFIRCELAVNPFEQAAQDRFAAMWKQWTSEVRAMDPELTIRYSSSMRHAADMARSMQRDMERIGLGSALGILMMTIGLFGSLRHLIAALLPVIISVFVGVGVTLLVFGGIHSVALVFGCSLIGVCVDYCLHYLVRHRLTGDWEPAPVMRSLAPAMNLSAATTTVAFLAMGLTPLVGLRQIALVSATGVLTAWLSVRLLLPWMLTHAHPRADRPPSVFRWLERALTHPVRLQRAVLLVLLVVVALGTFGFLRLRTDDSPRALSRRSAEIVREEEFIRESMGTDRQDGWLLVTGESRETLLARMEKLGAALTAAGPEVVETGPLISSFLPSRQRQEADREMLLAFLEDDAELRSEAARLGLPAEALARLRKELAKPLEPLTPDDWIASPVSLDQRMLWLGRTAGQFSALAPVTEWQDHERLKGLIASQEGVISLNQVEDLTRVLRHYRHGAVTVLGIAWAVIVTLLLARFRGDGWRVAVPPALAVVMTIGCLGAVGETLNLMHFLALMLVSGMGIDYAIFFAEAKGREAVATGAAITLSAITTILAFGLLSLSAQPVLHSIGLTILIGIALAWIFAPLAWKPS